MTEEPYHPKFMKEIDQNLKNRYWSNWRVCPKGHLNSPNAKVCWKCGSDKLERRKI